MYSKLLPYYWQKGIQGDRSDDTYFMKIVNTKMAKDEFTAFFFFWLLIVKDTVLKINDKWKLSNKSNKSRLISWSSYELFSLYSFPSSINMIRILKKSLSRI